MTLSIAPKKVSANATEKWVSFDENVEFLLRSLSDDKYMIGLERAKRMILREDSAQSLESISVSAGDVRELDIQRGLLGRFIIQGWRGPIVDADGNQVEYSPEAAASLLRANADVFAWVITQSAKISADTQNEAQETLGKSSPVTDGNSNANA